MEKINEEVLLQISCGGISKTLAAGIAIIGVFLVGFIDGILRPLRCNH